MAKFNRKKTLSRLLTFVLTAALLFGAVPLTVSATELGFDTEGPDYDGEILAAVNTDYTYSYYASTSAYDGASKKSKSFTATSLNSSEKPSDSSSDSSDKNKNYSEDDKFDFDSSEPVQVYAELPQVPLDQFKKANMLSDDVGYAQGSASYSVGNTRTIQSAFPKDNPAKIKLLCQFVGEHCTVWTQTDCDSDITLNSTMAAEIGNNFDSEYDNFVGYFGNYSIDVDGDGKIAIVCYDIDNEYPTKVSQYTTGYFWSSDLLKKGGTGNALDCIHIDTYPGMGGYNQPLTNIARSYSTLYHEYQHFTNYSALTLNDLESMEVYINEGMSMAAQHLVCGYSAVSNRASKFGKYCSEQPGRSVTTWVQGDLASYSFSYVFMQYVRTRYAALTGDTGKDDAGASVYMKIMDKYISGTNHNSF